jgi:hypothetical protein
MFIGKIDGANTVKLCIATLQISAEIWIFSPICYPFATQVSFKYSKGVHNLIVRPEIKIFFDGTGKSL